MKSVITVSNPWKCKKTDEFKSTMSLHPNVSPSGFRRIANAVEEIAGDKSVFKRFEHERGQPTWCATLADGVRLEGFAGSLSGRLNYVLPEYVRAIPEGAVEAFDEGEGAPEIEEELRAEAESLSEIARKLSDCADLLSASMDNFIRRLDSLSKKAPGEGD